MKIVFWSEEEKSGTTSNMLAAASYLAAKYSFRSVMIDMGLKCSHLEQSFSGTDESRYVNEACSYYVPQGLDYLLSVGKRKKLTEKQVFDSMRMVMEDRLYCLTFKEDMIRNPEEVRLVLGQVIALADQTMDFSFIDCGCRRDQDTMQLLTQADLVVANFKQSPRQLDAFFLNYSGVLEKVVYFIGNYQKDSAYNKKNIHRIYRIAPERIGVVPYNPEFQLACQKGRLDRFMKGKGNLYWTEQRQFFFRELEQALQILMRQKAGMGGEETDDFGTGSRSSDQ